MFVIPQIIAETFPENHKDQIYLIKLRNIYPMIEEFELMSNSDYFQILNENKVKLPPGIEHAFKIVFKPLFKTNYTGVVSCQSQNHKNVIKVPVNIQCKPLELIFVDTLLIDDIPVNYRQPVSFNIHNNESNLVHLDFIENPFFSCPSQHIVLEPNSQTLFTAYVTMKNHGKFLDEFKFVEERFGTLHLIPVLGNAILLDIQISNPNIVFPTIDSQKTSIIHSLISNKSKYAVEFNLKRIDHVHPITSDISLKSIEKSLKSLYRPWDVPICKPKVVQQLFLQQNSNTIFPFSNQRLEAHFTPTRQGDFNCDYFIYCSGIETPFLVSLKAFANGPIGNIEMMKSVVVMVGLNCKVPFRVLNMNDRMGLAYDINVVFSRELECQLNFSGYLNPNEFASLSLNILSSQSDNGTITLNTKFEGTDQVIVTHLQVLSELPKIEFKCTESFENTFNSPCSIPFSISECHLEYTIAVEPTANEYQLDSNELVVLERKEPTIALIAISPYGILGRHVILLELVPNCCFFECNRLITKQFIDIPYQFDFELVADNWFLNKEILTIKNVVADVDIQVELEHSILERKTINCILSCSTPQIIKFDLCSSSDILSVVCEFLNPVVALECNFKPLFTLSTSIFQICGSFERNLNCTLKAVINEDTLEFEYTTNDVLDVSYVFKENKSYSITFELYWRNSCLASLTTIVEVQNEPVIITGSLEYGKLPLISPITRNFEIKNCGHLTREFILKCAHPSINISCKRFKLAENEEKLLSIEICKIGQYEETLSIFCNNTQLALIPIHAVIATPKFMIQSPNSVDLYPNQANKRELKIYNPFDCELQAKLESTKYIDCPPSIVLLPKHHGVISLVINTPLLAKEAFQFVKFSFCFKNKKKQHVSLIVSNIPKIIKIDHIDALNNGYLHAFFKGNQNLSIVQDIGICKHFSNSILIKSCQSFSVIDDIGYMTEFQLELPIKTPIPMLTIQKQILFCSDVFDCSISIDKEYRIIVLNSLNNNIWMDFNKYHKNKAVFKVKLLVSHIEYSGYLDCLLDGQLTKIKYKIDRKPLVLSVNGTEYSYYDQLPVTMTAMKIENKSSFIVYFECDEATFINTLNITDHLTSFSIKGKLFTVNKSLNL